MDSKLTLKMDLEIIEKAKRFAKQRNTTLSILIENYFQNLTAREDSSDQISPLVKSLSGIIEIPEGDVNKEYTDYLMKKYS